MMSDAIDDALDDDEAEEETEDLTNQVDTLNFFVLFFGHHCSWFNNFDNVVKVVV